jgi:uncharacterized tellurite resistance protein B-like protein
MKNNADQSKISFRIIDEAEACAAVLMACRRADEIHGDVENAAFLNTVRSRNIFIGYDPDVLIFAAERYYEQAGSSAALIDAAVGAIREQTRLPLFYHCLDVILSDGVVTPMEHKVFQYLKGKFKIEDEVAFKAMEVLVVKNQL